MARIKRAAQWLITANTAVVTVLAILLALVAGAILVVVGNHDVLAEWGYFGAEPGKVLGDTWTIIADAYTNLFEGAIVDPAAISGAADGTNSWSQVFYPISETLRFAAPLVFTGLAVALAFRGGMFNIGAQGQAIMGAIGGALVGFGIHLPAGPHLVAALVGAALGGAVWGFIPGILKARTGAHEVIVTIMLNYIGLNLLTWLIRQSGVHDPSRPDAISKKIDSGAHLPLLGGAGLGWNVGILLGVLAVVVVAWLLDRSTRGFELRAVGANPAAARTAGMSVGRTYVLIMVFSGALAGLGGGTLVLGTAYSLTGSVTGSVGFDGITVALLGRGKPWGVFASALLIGAMHAGSNRVQAYSHVALDLVNVLQAVILVFIAAPRLVQEMFRLRAPRDGAASGDLAKGW